MTYKGSSSFASNLRGIYQIEWIVYHDPDRIMMRTQTMQIIYQNGSEQRPQFSCLICHLFCGTDFTLLIKIKLFPLLKRQPESGDCRSWRDKQDLEVTFVLDDWISGQFVCFSSV